jgi:formylglycine-generating enzyme required for sulfatase activity
MGKYALLIGVSEYQAEGLKPLPSAGRDVEAMRRVLQHPEMGGFRAEDVVMLTNPTKGQVEAALHGLFAGRQKNDLLLFYFSGHGVKDDGGKLYFTLPETLKDARGLVKYTAIAASTLHESMGDSRSQYQVLVLDCCFAGAIAKGMTIKDDGSVDVRSQLGGKGRAIFAASASSQYSFQQEDLPLSVYTQFFVEGIEKGAADEDGDGQISADELHRYVFGKVQKVAPAMTPQFYPVEDGHRIYLAKSPKDDPALKYRKEVERWVKQGAFNVERDRFSVAARNLLEEQRKKLQLSVDEAEAIASEVLQPLREYERKKAKYRQTLIEAKEDEELPFCDATQNALKEYQVILGLRDEDVEAIVRDVLVPPLRVPPVYFSTSSPPESSTHESFTLALDDKVQLEMLAIPSGTFWMGSPDGEGYDNERPRHKVTIAPFWMGKYPITQAQYQAVMGKNPSRFKGDRRPVEKVSWHDAIAFCKQLRGKDNRHFRLPSEAEWEYACRAGTETPFYFGETITTDQANYRGTDWEYNGTVYPGNYGSGPKGEYREQTTDVGIFPANAFGLYDMHGNVWEWCADHWHGNYEGAPIDGSAWLDENADTEARRVLRGGSWINIPRYCRSASRYRYVAGIRNCNFGFRVVCSAPRTL